MLGPDFAQTALGLRPKDIAVIVLPLGGGIVVGILLLNSYGKFLPRRRVIEGGLVVLGVARRCSIAGPISQFLQRVDQAGDLLDLSAVASLLAVVVFIAFIAGIAYAAVAIPSQTQLQEDLPEDVRGRVFGVLNMLVSVSSFLPIIIVGPISDLIGTATVMLVVAIAVIIAGVAGVLDGARTDVAGDGRSPCRGSDRGGARRGSALVARTPRPAAPPRPATSAAGVGPARPAPILPTATDRCLGSRSSSPADDQHGLVRGRWRRAVARWRRHPRADAGPRRYADVVPIDRGLTPASHFVRRPHVARRGDPRRSPRRRTMASWWSRAPIRSRRRRSRGTSSSTHRSRSS